MDVNAAGNAVQLLSGKRTLHVLTELAHGPRRHNELARALGVDHKPLDNALRRLQDARLVVREVDPAPLRVSYRLTAEAKAVLTALDDLAEAWRNIGLDELGGTGLPYRRCPGERCPGVQRSGEQRSGEQRSGGPDRSGTRR